MIVEEYFAQEIVFSLASAIMLMVFGARPLRTVSPAGLLVLHKAAVSFLFMITMTLY